MSVDVTGDSEHVTIAITDSGIGIPAEDLSHLFQKFYRVDNSDTREIGGTGLGLYLCRRLAETIGGRVWAESTYKKGSTFYLELPRIDTAQAQHLKKEQDEAAAEARAAAEANAKTKAAAAVQATKTIEAAPPTPAPFTPAPPRPASTLTPPPAQAPTAGQIAHPPITSPVAPSVPVPRTNTPLNSIEKNPSAFTQPRNGAIAVPTRN